MATGEQLQATLDALGMESASLRSADGARVLVQTHGARVLGLFLPGENDNVLWTNPVLACATAATELYAGEAWHNSGGDRTWLAPELDFFYPRYPDLQAYRPPRAMDPADYRMTTEAHGISLHSDMALHAARTGEPCACRLEKTVTLLENPLQASGLDALSFAGYSVRTVLEATRPLPRTRIGLWSLLQLPAAGQMIIPTTARCAPRVFFGVFRNGDLAVAERGIHYTMDAPATQKIAVRADVCTGRLGYVYGAGAVRTLVIREFAVNPAGAYIDVPVDDQTDEGYAVQACNVAEALLGRFNEMEYHAPAIGGATGLSRCEDVSRLWAFRGEAAAISAAITALLGDVMGDHRVTPLPVDVRQP